jgi:hypothetical protein
VQAPGGFASPNSPAEECPGLDLVTGFNDDRRKTLTREHPHYELFALAWREQDRWTKDKHRVFWEATLPLWPSNAGNKANVEALAWHVAWLHSHGYSDCAIAEAMGYPLDTLRRQRVLGRAREYPLHAPSGPRLPRVYSLDAGEPEPSHHGVINVRSDLRRFHDRLSARIRGEPMPVAPQHRLDPPTEPGRSIANAARRARAHLESDP